MLGLRVRGIIRRDVRHALGERRSLVKRVGLRDTLHLLPAEEVPYCPQPIDRIEFERRLEARVGVWAIGTNQGWVGSYKNWPMALGHAAALGLVRTRTGDCQAAFCRTLGGAGRGRGRWQAAVDAFVGSGT